MEVDSNKTILYRVKHQYDQVLFLIHELPIEDLYKNHTPGKWSVFQNLAHLGRYQQVFLGRIHIILEEEVPVFSRYIAEQDKLFEKWKSMSYNEVIEKTKNKRTEIYDFLASLTPEKTLKKGIHPKLGPLTIQEWTEFFLLHESHHFYTIFWICKEFRAMSLKTS